LSNIEHIYSSLVSPSKGVNEAELEPIHGTSIPLNGDLFAMLANVYDRADDECNIPIRFISDGSQNNVVRDALITLVEKPNVTKANNLAERLSSVTTNRSGLGLLFFVLGNEDREHKLLISRFPANHGILAEAKAHGLTVEYVERVFMKNSATYKAALYRAHAPSAQMWDGVVVDKQIEAAANYWINDFLLSTLRTTSKAGSRRLATAMKEAARGVESVEQKHQLISAMSLMAGLKGKTISARDIFDRFGLSEDLCNAVVARLPNDISVDTTFVLDADEFRDVAGYRSVRLNTGGVLTAATDEFEDVFKREVIDPETNRVKFSTVGNVVDEKVKSNAS
jgi:hypothetical protein